ncbi:ABC transporter ATP-binding protein [Methylobacterium oryzihabitans]|uniref:ABC transporter ATP-binding protein n=1 Tax=Methylobacterium oryzihabitans TaxID=2499852 RepID=A0A437NPR0_9HYPH|nr:ABC transporter ATP-binding protein [Methylobacterium oryzihabitans]RVU11993.1 ABC transporter ATP-binding protein [Methylobacterium oryzihabitans]
MDAGHALQAKSLSREFGGFFAVRDVDFTLHRGSIQAVIGPNGAGKSTLFNLLTKHIAPSSGEIFHEGDDVTGLSMPALAKRGVVRSFQISAVFASLTVRQNLELALLRPAGSAWDLLGRVTGKRAIAERADALLERFELGECAESLAGNLSYGRKRVLELATTLALEPRVLLLDEPMAGLGREDIGRVTDLIREVGEGRTILLVEHNMKVVADLADRITVMVRGRILAEGPYDEVSARADVVAAYTGQGHD